MCHDAIKRRSRKRRKRRTQEPCGHTTFAKKEELSPKGIPTLLQAGKLSPFPSKKGTQEEILTLGEDVWKHAILPEFRGPRTPSYGPAAAGEPPPPAVRAFSGGAKSRRNAPKERGRKKKKKRREATHRREVGRGPANNEREARGNRR